MNILIISQHFWPESFLINSVAADLQRSGAHVTVLTGQPNYPQGKIYDGYNALKYHAEKHPSGVMVYRVPMLPRKNGGAVNLIANYLSFMLSASFLGPFLLRKSKIDVIFVFATSPVFQSLAGVVFRLIRRVALVVWVQDLWPDVLEGTGFVRNRKALSAIGFAVGWLYRRADMILVQSNAFIEDVLARHPLAVVKYHPNTCIKLHQGGPKVDLGLGGKFSVMFAGNFGKAQALQTVLESAEILREHRDILFVLVGTGSQAEAIANTVAQKKLNVILPGHFPSEEMAGLFKQASALLITLTKNALVSKTVPSKLQTYMATGKPILAAIDGEGSRLILEADAGFVSRAEDPISLSKNILKLKSAGAKEQKRLGQNAVDYFEKNFQHEKLTENLLALLANAVTSYESRNSKRKRIKNEN